ncbi:MAG: EAL domain-containing protein [Betaproteobacteria bacterium]|nr:EAL domain-containing protein [Betaproteobacteria bacterium]
MTQKQKILLAFILPAIAALIAVWLFVDRLHQKLSVERWSNEHQSFVRIIAQSMQEQINGAANRLAYTARLPEFSSLSAVDRVNPAINGIPLDLERTKRQTLDALLASDSNLGVVFLLLPNGDHYLSHPYSIQQSLKKYNLADRPYFQEATRSKKPAVSDSIQGADGMPAVVIDTPLTDGRGKIFAHLGGVVYLKHLSQLLSPEDIAPFDNGLLADREGMLIGHSDASLIGGLHALSKAEHPLLGTLNGNKEEIAFRQWQDQQGVAWLSFIYRLDSGWQLVLSRRLDSVMAETAPITQQMTLLVGLILLITSGIGLALAMRFAQRWERSDDQLRQANDQLETRVAQRTEELSASQVQLQKSHDFYLTILEHFPTLIWRAGLDGQCNYFNATWLEFTGRSLEQEKGEGWAEGVHADDRERCITTYQADFLARRPFAMEYRLRRHDGEYRWILDIGHPFINLAGEFAGYLGACFDVTERHESAEQLGLIASVFSHAREGIIITDPKDIIVDVNQAFTEITGYSRDEVIGRKPSLLKSGHQSPEFYVAMWAELARSDYWHGEIWNRKKSGELYAEQLTISAVRSESGDVRHYVGIFADITQQKEHERHLEKLAHFDPLTELPNRTLLNDRLYMSIALAARNKTMLAVCLLDLDGFKAVNDRYGHAAGDQLLIEFSQRTLAIMRDTDTLSRLGGDEFVLLLNDLDNLEQCLEIVRRVLQVASCGYDIAGEAVCVSASVGITIFPGDGVEPELLLRHADQAMYIAKQTGRNRYFLFDPMKDEAARTELADLQRLEQALLAGEFEMHYQPKVDMRGGIVTGAEALIRWRHPERGLIQPGEFLPITENNDFAITLGEWVINAALCQADHWHRQGLPLNISINIAARHISLPDFTARLAKLLSAYPALPHGRIELEILETAALSDTGHVSQVIESCRELGVSFALDDFGTGYSSLLYLKHLPAETLKIDQSFIRDMQDDAEDMAIVKGVIGLAQAFNRSVIAEGVETIAHGDILLALGCAHAQGYGISRPMPPSEFETWLSHWKTPASWAISAEK